MKTYNKKIGDFGEKIARDYLERKGYKIIDFNVKLSYKEIDIIAKIKKKIVFVEVKTRTSRNLGYANEMMTNRKIENLKKGMLDYSFKNKIDLNYVRLDFISVDIFKEKKTAKIKHYKDII